MRGLHAEIERLLAAASLGVTVIRPGMFASNARHWWGPQIRSGDVVRWPYGAAETAPVEPPSLAPDYETILEQALQEQALRKTA